MILKKYIRKLESKIRVYRSRSTASAHDFTLNPLEPRLLLSASSSAIGGELTTVTSPPALGGGSSQSAMDLIRLNEFHSKYRAIRGQNSSVAILSTGIDIDHPAFGGSNNGISSTRISDDSYNYVFNDDDIDDQFGLGTFAAGIIGAKKSSNWDIAGVAPDVNFIVLPVYEPFAMAVDDLAFNDAIDWIREHIVDDNNEQNIVSIFTNQMTVTPVPEVYDYAYDAENSKDNFQIIAQADVITVGTSGFKYKTLNSDPGVAWPASDPNVLAVSSVFSQDNGNFVVNSDSSARSFTSASDRLAPDTNRHPSLTDIFAPSVKILSAGVDGTIAEGSGTAHVAYVSGAAVVAQQLANLYMGRSLTFAEFQTYIQNTGVTIYDGDENNNGVIDPGDEDDNVVNSQAYYKRLDLVALAEKILEADTTQPTVSFTGIPTGPVVPSHTIGLQFSEHINYTNLTPADFSLKLNGTPVDLTGLLINDADPDNIDDINFTFSNLELYTQTSGQYELTILKDNVYDYAGNVLTADVQITWTVDAQPPQAISVQAFAGTGNIVNSFVVEFSEPVMGFSEHNLQLLFQSQVGYQFTGATFTPDATGEQWTITNTDFTYNLTSFTNQPGHYAFRALGGITENAITDIAGNPLLLNSDFVEWHVDPTSQIDGDLNLDSNVDQDDIDIMNAALFHEFTDSYYDLDSDSDVDEDDKRHLIVEAGGDYNDDGIFNYLDTIDLLSESRKQISNSTYTADAKYDINQDNVFDYKDRDIMLIDWMNRIHDLNNDFKIDELDIEILEEQTAISQNQNPLYDFNEDGLVDYADESILIGEIIGFQSGDATIDGIINLNDLALLASSFGDQGGWRNGNFTFDLLVNLEDLAKLATTFGNTGGFKYLEYDLEQVEYVGSYNPPPIQYQSGWLIQENPVDDDNDGTSSIAFKLFVPDDIGTILGITIQIDAAQGTTLEQITDPTYYPQTIFEDYNLFMEYLGYNPENDTQLSWLTSEIWNAMGQIENDDLLKASIVFNSGIETGMQDVNTEAIYLGQVALNPGESASVTVVLAVENDLGEMEMIHLSILNLNLPTV